MQVVSRFRIGRVLFASAFLSAAIIVASPLNGSAETQTKTQPTPEIRRTAPAEKPSSNTEQPKPTVSFCSNLDTKTSEITTQIESLSGRLSQAQLQQDQKIGPSEQQIDQKVAAGRAEADTKRAANFAKLEAKATTDAQKEAVSVYKSAVEAALKVRRDAFDAARSDFRFSVQSEIENRRNSVSAQINTLKSSVNAAIATAKASCAEDGVANSISARTTFLASMKSAHDAFKTKRTDDAGAGTQVKTFAATRDAAFRAAEQAFQTSIASARQALMQAFGNSTAVK